MCFIPQRNVHTLPYLLQHPGVRALAPHDQGLDQHRAVEPVGAAAAAALPIQEAVGREQGQGGRYKPSRGGPRGRSDRASTAFAGKASSPSGVQRRSVGLVKVRITRRPEVHHQPEEGVRYWQCRALAERSQRPHVYRSPGCQLAGPAEVVSEDGQRHQPVPQDDVEQRLHTGWVATQHPHHQVGLGRQAGRERLGR